MTNKTFKEGILFVIYAIFLIAGLCLSAFEKTITSIIMFGFAFIIIIINILYSIYSKDK